MAMLKLTFDWKSALQCLDYSLGFHYLGLTVQPAHGLILIVQFALPVRVKTIYYFLFLGLWG